MKWSTTREGSRQARWYRGRARPVRVPSSSQPRATHPTRVPTTGDPHGGLPAAPPVRPRPASPDLPSLEKDVLAYWEPTARSRRRSTRARRARTAATSRLNNHKTTKKKKKKKKKNKIQTQNPDGTFQASVDARPAGEHGSNEFVFYDGPPVRQRPAALRPPADRLRQGRRAALPDDARPPRRAPVRLGHARPARRARGAAPPRHHGHLPDRGDGPGRVQPGVPRVGPAVHRRVARVRDAAGALGRLRPRLQDARHHVHGVGDLGVQALYDKGLAYEGYRVLPYCWRDETPLSNHELRMDDDVYQSRQDPALTVGLRLETGELALIWTTTPWTLPSNLAIAVGPDVDYVTVEPGPDSALAGELVVLAAARGSARTPRSSARPPSSRPSRAATSRAAGTRRRSTTSPATRTRTRCCSATSSPPRTARASCTWRPRSARTTWSRARPSASPPSSPSTRAAGSPPRSRTTSACRCSRPTSRSPRTSRRAPARWRVPRETQRSVVVRHETYEHSYPHCWRCRNPLIYKAVSSWFVRVTRVPRPHGRAQPGDHLDPGPHQGRPVRQVAVQRARLVDQPQPLLGHAHPGVGLRRPGAPARRRVRLAGRAGGGLRPGADERGGRAGPAPAVHRRADAPEPGRPDRRLDDAPDPRRARRVVRLGLDAVRAGALPVRERRLVRAPLPGRLHRRVHRPDPRLVLHAARAGHGDLRPPGVPQRHVPRHRARRRRPQGVQVACATSRTRSRCGTSYGSDAVRWFLMSSSILRGGNLIVGEEGIRDGVRQVLLPLWSTYYFFSLYAGAANGGAGYTAKAVDAERAAGLAPMDRYVLSRTRRPRRDGDRADGRVRHRGGVRVGARAPRRADQLVRPHPAGPVLGRGRRRVRHAVDLARGAHARHGAAGPAGHRGGLARAHRRAQRAPGRLADGRRVRRVARRGDGPGPRGDVHRARPAQGRRRARAAAAAHADGRGRRRGRAGAVRRPARGRAQRQGGRPGHGRRGHRRAVRHHAAARGQRARGRSAARSRGPGGHPGRARGRLERPGRDGRRGRRRAGAERVRADHGRGVGGRVPPPRCCPAAASSCST